MPNLLRVNGRLAVEYRLDSDLSHLVYLTREEDHRMPQSENLLVEEGERGVERDRLAFGPVKFRLKERGRSVARSVQQFRDLVLKAHR